MNIRLCIGVHTQRQGMGRLLSRSPLVINGPDIINIRFCFVPVRGDKLLAHFLFITNILQPIFITVLACQACLTNVI